MSQSREVRGVATSVRIDDDAIRVQYHATVIFTKFTNGVIYLNTGGYKTATTKLRMNQAANQFCDGRFFVYQSKFQWWLATSHNLDFRFDGDACVLTPNGGFASGSPELMYQRAINWSK